MNLLMILAGCCTVCQTVGNTVSMSSSTGSVGEPLEIACSLNPPSGATITSVKWFRGNDANGIQFSAATCNLVGQTESFDLSRYSFTCSSNTFKLKILALKSSDDGQCWSCSVTFTSLPETDKASAACIKVQSNNNLLLLLLMIILVLPLAIIIILICCGCLDCCKCCRTFYHYDEHKCCYVTCYCLQRRCCSFFFCRPGSERGTLFGGHKNKKEHCGGSYSGLEKCVCGWPNFCKHTKMRSCGGCCCICCVEGRTDEVITCF